MQGTPFDASYTGKGRLTQRKWRSNQMTQELKATYADGVFKPVTPVDLDDGAIVVISVMEDAQSENHFQGLEASAGGWRDIVDYEQLTEYIYERRAAESRGQPLPDLP